MIRAILVVLLFGLTAVPLVGGETVLHADDLTEQTLAPDACAGDEEISFAPAEPAAGEDLLIVVRSSTRHRGVWLHSADRPELLRQYPGSTGWVWTWLVTPSWPGDHHFRFFVDSTSLCAEAWLTVGPPTTASGLARVGSPVPFGAATPTVTRGAPDDNGNGSDNENGNDNTSRRRTPTSTLTPTVTLTPSPTPIPEPRITKLSATTICTGQQLTISGKGFGNPRSVVDGEVLIAGRSVSEYLRWRDSEIVVVVPDAGTPETDQTLYVVTLGGFDEETITYLSNCGG